MRQHSRRGITIIAGMYLKREPKRDHKGIEALEMWDVRRRGTKGGDKIPLCKGG